MASFDRAGLLLATSIRFQLPADGMAWTGDPGASSVARNRELVEQGWRPQSRTDSGSFIVFASRCGIKARPGERYRAAPRIASIASLASMGDA